MRNYIIGAAILIAIFVSVMGFMAYTKIRDQGPPPENAAAVQEARAKAKRLVHMCEDVVAPTLGTIKTNAAPLPELFKSDRDKAKATVANNIVAAIETRELACNEAKKDMDFVNANMKVPDPEMKDGAAKLDTQIDALKKIRANANALTAALDANAAPDELQKKLDTLIANP
ncbi:MAG: hypothetical protein QM831_46190 [Kofleriaceae bacterium]